MRYTDNSGFFLRDIHTGIMHEDFDGVYRTLVFGFKSGDKLSLPDGHNHFGFVVSGSISIAHGNVRRELTAGDFFSVGGGCVVTSRDGEGMVTSAQGYFGLNVFGGPIEATGRLRYIDGCTDTLLVPPVRKGDPCLNYLHFPPAITQTPHTHPSVRSGIVVRGEGECILPGADPIPLIPGKVFVISTDTVHSFNTGKSHMDIVAFHPDSDTGMTDDDHPMVNKTIVNGISANAIREIRTK